ncbi:MAG: ribbon-helix-helix protein, CopG family [Betaproteobacteria bacterium]|nr:ribbon-helix-helix protein, CopG family [Betaproteobacteria bacterium]
MQRTQILLDDWQYQALKARAQREGRSMSDLLRQILDAHLGKAAARTPRLADIRAVGEDRTARGRDHDRFLYGKSGRR